MASSERKDGPTPNGGAYSIVYFQDEQGNPVEKEQATKMEAVEFDAADNQVFRTYLTKSGAQEEAGESLLDR